MRRPSDTAGALFAKEGSGEPGVHPRSSADGGGVTAPGPMRVGFAPAVVDGCIPATR